MHRSFCTGINEVFQFPLVTFSIENFTPNSIYKSNQNMFITQALLAGNVTAAGNGWLPRGDVAIGWACFNGSQLAKEKKVYAPTCHCHEIYRVEAYSSKCPIILKELWFLWVRKIWGNFTKKLNFVLSNHRALHFVSIKSVFS